MFIILIVYKLSEWKLMKRFSFKCAAVFIVFSLLGVSLASARGECSCCQKPLDGGSFCPIFPAGSDGCCCGNVPQVEPWDMERCFFEVSHEPGFVIPRVGDYFSWTEWESATPQFLSICPVFLDLKGIENLSQMVAQHRLSLRC